MTFENLKYLVQKIKGYVSDYAYIKDGVLHVGDSSVNPESSTNKTTTLTDSDVQYPTSNAVKKEITSINDTIEDIKPLIYAGL